LHTSNLSAILQSIVESGLPSKRIVLKTYSSGRLVELCNRPSRQGSAAQHTTPILSGHHQDEYGPLDARRGPLEGVESGGQTYQAWYEVAEESIPEQTTGDALPVATPEDCLLADTGGYPEDSAPQREGRPVACHDRLHRWQRR
jgi:hypothetical protein